MMSHKCQRCAFLPVLVLSALGVPGVPADRTKLKPGMNSFTPQQDIIDTLQEENANLQVTESPSLGMLNNEQEMTTYLRK